MHLASRRTPKSTVGICLYPQNNFAHSLGLEAALTQPPAQVWKTPYLSEDGEALSHCVPLVGNAEVRLAKAAPVALYDGALDPVWLAAYTTPRHEKMVARHLEAREVEYLLPLYKSIRRWKNGLKVEVEFPLFPNYVFVRTAQRMSARLLEVPGVLSFAGSPRVPAAISDSEIEWLRSELSLRRYAPHPFLVVGSKVRIASGPLTGVSGVLIRTKSGLRVVLSVDLIRQSVAVEVGADEIEPCRT